MFQSHLRIVLDWFFYSKFVVYYFVAVVDVILILLLLMFIILLLLMFTILLLLLFTLRRVETVCGTNSWLQKMYRFWLRNVLHIFPYMVCLYSIILYNIYHFERWKWVTWNWLMNTSSSILNYLCSLSARRNNL